MTDRKTTDRKSAAQQTRKPAARAASPAKPAPAKPAAAKSAAKAPARKHQPVAAKKVTRAAKVTGPAVSAAPLLARETKKVSKAATKAPNPDAPYQPKTEPPPAGHNSGAAMPAPSPAPLPRMVNPLAIAAPWMRLGAHMTLAGFAMQARIARAALAAPTAIALSQSTMAFDAWRSLLAPRKPEKS